MSPDQSPKPVALPGEPDGEAETKSLPGGLQQTNGSKADAGSPGSAALPAPGLNLPVIPEHKILGVLGRGGMGIVYQALHVPLQRMVALKMILGAAPEGTARFLTEARAVARVQHPNIVQIYEVGEHEGQPYFTFEYVDGTTLARQLAGKPQPPRDAAQLVETLARAIHAAHQRGIIHRDLKPANVLLNVDGLPKITDFGLAKQLDDDSGQTRTGAVMGTPSYMAPEQASGDLGSIGRRTDVYALGAILYEMLTGRPPFRGVTVLETLDQVRSSEPVPPSHVQSKLPRDLETICLKALAKEPGRRYDSALALAQDLERFCGGESILARPEGMVRKLWRRIRRSPMVYASAAAIPLAIALAGFVTWRARQTSSQAQALTKSFNDALNKEDWNAGHLETLESLADELQELGVPDLNRAVIYKRLDSLVHASLRKTALREKDIERVQAHLALLAARDPDLARQAQLDFRDRCAETQEVFALAPPFADLQTVFQPSQIRLIDAALTATANAGDKKQSDNQSFVLTKVPCQGNVELEGVFDVPASDHFQVGLVLNGDPKRKGYWFLLSRAKKEEPIQLDIVRNDVRQRQERLTGVSWPLQLRAVRNGDLLTFQVNARHEGEHIHLASVAFRDPFP